MGRRSRLACAAFMLVVGASCTDTGDERTAESITSTASVAASPTSAGPTPPSPRPSSTMAVDATASPTKPTTVATAATTTGQIATVTTFPEEDPRWCPFPAEELARLLETPQVPALTMAWAPMVGDPDFDGSLFCNWSNDDFRIEYHRARTENPMETIQVYAPDEVLYPDGIATWLTERSIAGAVLATPDPTGAGVPFDGSLGARRAFFAQALECDVVTVLLQPRPGISTTADAAQRVGEALVAGLGDSSNVVAC